MSSYFPEDAKFDRHKGDAAPKPGRQRKPKPADAPEAPADHAGPMSLADEPEQVVDLLATYNARKGGPRTGVHRKRRQQFERRRQMVSGWAESDKWMPIFLQALATKGTVTSAIDAARISRPTAYNRRNECAEFREAWDEAEEEAADRLQEELMRRAIEGDPIHASHQGKKGDEIARRKSDILGIFILKGLRPKFRDSYQGDKNTEADQQAKAIADFLGQFSASVVQAAVQGISRREPEPLALDVTPEGSDG